MKIGPCPSDCPSAMLVMAFAISWSRPMHVTLVPIDVDGTAQGHERHRASGQTRQRAPGRWSGSHNGVRMPSSTSLAGLTKWLGRDEWHEDFEEILWLHVGPACERAGITFDDVAGAGTGSKLRGCHYRYFGSPITGRHGRPG
jgi:hypothetical protein